MMKKAILVSSVAFAGAHALPGGNLRHSAALVAVETEADLNANPSTHFGNLHPGVDKVMSKMDNSFATLDQKKQDVQKEGLSTAAMVIESVKAGNNGVKIADSIRMLKASIAADKKSIAKVQADIESVEKAHKSALKDLEDGSDIAKVQARIDQSSKSVSLLDNKLQDAGTAREKASDALNKVQTLQKEVETANEDLAKAQAAYDETEYQYRKIQIDSAQEEELSTAASRSAQASESKLKQRASVIAEAQASVDSLKAALKQDEASTEQSYNGMMTQYNKKKAALMTKKAEAEKQIAEDREELAKVEKTRVRHSRLQSGARADYQKAADDASAAKDKVWDEAGKKMANERGADFLKKNDWAWMHSLLQQKRQEKDAELQQESKQSMSLQQQFEIAQAAKRATKEAKEEAIDA